MTILDQLAAHARKRVAAYKAVLPLEEVRRQCEALPSGSFALDAALAKPGLSFIGECKKASPSKGLIAPEFPYLARIRALAPGRPLWQAHRMAAIADGAIVGSAIVKLMAQYGSEAPAHVGEFVRRMKQAL